MTETDLKLAADSGYAEKMGLDPSALSSVEFQLYGAVLTLKTIPYYLQIRNGIIRLWHESFPTRLMKMEDVIGSFMAPNSHRNTSTYISFAFKYLDRYRFINYGVISSDFIPVTASGTPVLICGAGVAGLATAREIHNIFLNQKHTPHPKIMLLEARQRIGGRILTFPLHCRWNDSKMFSAADLGPDLIDCLNLTNGR